MIRITNVIERYFIEVRQRIKVMGHFQNFRSYVRTSGRKGVKKDVIVGKS